MRPSESETLDRDLVMSEKDNVVMQMLVYIWKLLPDVCVSVLRGLYMTCANSST